MRCASAERRRRDRSTRPPCPSACPLHRSPRGARIPGPGHAPTGVAAYRLHDPQVIAAHGTARFDELHAAPAQVRRSRQVDAAAAAHSRKRDQWRGVKLGGQWRIHGDAQARAQIKVAVGCAVRRQARCHAALCGQERRRRSFFKRWRRADRSWTRNSEGVTRMCRCEPLLSNQSNKWDELRQVRLSARSGPAQCCLQAISPWVFKLGSRGNPATLSNTAGDAGVTLHTMRAAASHCGV